MGEAISQGLAHFGAPHRAARTRSHKWRRRESNPRPEDSTAGVYRLIRFFPLTGRSSNRQGLRPASPSRLRRPSGAPGRRTPTLSHPIRPRRRWARSSGSPHRGTVPSRWLRRPAGEPRSRGWHLLFARVVHGVRAAPACHRRSASPVEPSSPPHSLIISQSRLPGEAPRKLLEQPGRFRRARWARPLSGRGPSPPCHRAASPASKVSEGQRSAPSGPPTGGEGVG